jgi:hypothetical protein
MNKKYTFTMVVVKPTGKGGKPLKPKPIKPENKSTGGGMMKKYNKGGEMLKGGQKKLDKREIGRRGRDPYAVQPRKPSPQPLDKPKPGIGSLQKADIEKNNKINQVKAKYASLKETARDELTPMKSDRVFSKYRRPDSAKEFYADEPGSKYEGMAKEAMKEKINYFKNMKRGGLTGGQKKLDKNKDGKITGEDFKMMKQGYGAARKDGMGLQDEKVKPGKVQKVFLGKMIKGAGKSIGRLFGKNKSATATPSGEDMGGRIGIFPVGIGPIKALIDDGNIKPASKGRMMKASKGGGMMQRPMGGEIKKGYGAARQSGMGLQDENLQPGKSMDYYKDLI